MLDQSERMLLRTKTVFGNTSRRAMDFTFLDDPIAIAEILATAEPAHRALQRANGWDDKTLAIEIARIRQSEEEEWKERVIRMSDEELTHEDDVIRAKIDPCVGKYRAMSGVQRDQVASAMIMILKWGKNRLAFTQQERQFREEKNRFSQRLPSMSDEVLRAELKSVDEQISRHCQKLMSLPFNGEPHVREEIERRSRMSEAKHEVLIKERNRRGQ